MSFPAYPSYGDSGVEWLGEVPSHWSIERLRIRASLITTKAEAQTRPIALENIEGWSGKLIESDTEFQNDGVAFETGDILFGKLRPYLAKVYAAEFSGQAVGDFVVIRPAKSADAKFISYCLLTRQLISLIDGSTYGAKMPRASWDFIREVRFAFPPLAEQVTIVAFLDRETAKIDALIEEQRRLVALLKEKQQAVISYTTTKGVNRHAPMKDSGIEWLGEVPAHWQVKRLSTVAQFKSGNAHEPLLDDTADEHIYVSARFVSSQGKALRFCSANLTPARRQDILMVMSDLPNGRALARAYMVTDDRSYAVNQRVCIVRCEQAQPRFMFYQLDRNEGLLRYDDGVNQTHLPNRAFTKLIVCVPPLHEQEEIAADLDRRLTACDDLAMGAERGIELLTERRAALISAAVTGKIDVRAPAKVLSFPIDRARARGLVAAEIIERSAHQATFGRVKFQKVAFLAEGHVGVSELAGSYLREAAGPLDRDMIDEMESGARTIAGVTVDQAGGTGTAVTYTPRQQRGAHRQELADWLGPDRTAKLDKLIADFAHLTTKQAEAVATLYGVWNDALIDGALSSDDDIISGFLNDWHPEKRAKFRASELPEWLGWMRRHDIVPTGSGPKTMTGRLFV